MAGYVRVANQFSDPAGVQAVFNWPVNHTTEEEVDKSRQMGDGAPTSDIGLLPMQGAPTPLVFSWKGTIFTQSHLTSMFTWWNLCESQSIYLTDFAGSKYEVLITDFKPLRKGVAWNQRGQVPWLWEYTITFRVLKVISGEWTGITP